MPHILPHSPEDIARANSSLRAAMGLHADQPIEEGVPISLSVRALAVLLEEFFSAYLEELSLSLNEDSVDLYGKCSRRIIGWQSPLANYTDKDPNIITGVLLVCRARLSTY